LIAESGGGLCAQNLPCHVGVPGAVCAAACGVKPLSGFGPEEVVAVSVQLGLELGDPFKQLPAKTVERFVEVGVPLPLAGMSGLRALLLRSLVASFEETWQQRHSATKRVRLGPMIAPVVAHERREALPFLPTVLGKELMHALLECLLRHSAPGPKELLLQPLRRIPPYCWL